jgi:hypothetical protein
MQAMIITIILMLVTPLLLRRNGRGKVFRELVRLNVAQYIEESLGNFVDYAYKLKIVHTVDVDSLFD